MTKTRHEEHCSDESLLAHLDGELPREQDAWVSKHLKTCWRCRANLADLEAQAVAVAKALRADNFPGPERIAQARCRISEFQRDFEAGFFRPPKTATPRRGAIGRLAWAVGVAGCLAATTWVSRPIVPRPSVVKPPRPSAVTVPEALWEPLPKPPEVPFAKITPATPRMFGSTNPADLRALEIDIYSALHRFGACLGMPIEVTVDPAGCVVVRGLVNSTAEKIDLAATIGQVRSPGCYRLDVTTVTEAAAQRPGKESAHRPVPRPIEVVGGEMPLQAELESYFSHQPGSDAVSVRRQAVELANGAVAHADRLLAEAWALRHLAERFGKERRDQMPATAAWQLEVIVRDHLRAVQEEHGKLWNLLGPPLASLTGRISTARASEGFTPEPEDWHSASLRVFRAAARQRASVLALFAGAAAPGGGEDETARLLSLLRESASELDEAILALNVDFAARPFEKAHRDPPE